MQNKKCFLADENTLHNTQEMSQNGVGSIIYVVCVRE